MYVFEIEDLQDDSFLILCVKQTQKVYMWKGKQFAEKEMVGSCEQPVQQFVDSAVLNYFDETVLEDLEFFSETPHEESEDFLQFF